MKKIYFLLTAVVMFFISCERNIDTFESLYLCNNLDKDIILELFSGDEVFKYLLKPNDTIYWNTITSEYTKSIQKGFNFAHFHLPDYEYNEFLFIFDSAAVSYDSFIYTFSRNIPYDDSNKNPNTTIEEMIYRDSIYEYIYDSVYKYNKPILYITYAIPQKNKIENNLKHAYSKEYSNSYHTYDIKYLQYLEDKIRRLYILGKL